MSLTEREPHNLDFAMRTLLWHVREDPRLLELVALTQRGDVVELVKRAAWGDAKAEAALLGWAARGGRAAH
jgi:hypothetical protein